MTAATEYLIGENYTSSERLSISGGSNGGLTVGAVLTQRPDTWSRRFAVTFRCSICLDSTPSCSVSQLLLRHLTLRRRPSGVEQRRSSVVAVASVMFAAISTSVSVPTVVCQQIGLEYIPFITRTRQKVIQHVNGRITV